VGAVDFDQHACRPQLVGADPALATEELADLRLRPPLLDAESGVLGAEDHQRLAALAGGEGRRALHRGGERAENALRVAVQLLR
jgi:hypothetical protein